MHTQKCKQYTIDGKLWHSAICESLNVNYLYARHWSDNYARAICLLLQNEYRESSYNVFTERK